MGSRRAYDDEDVNETEQLVRAAARHGYRLQIDGEDVCFVDPLTGETSVSLCWEEIAYNLEEFRSGDLMNGRNNLVRDPEFVFSRDAEPDAT